MLNTIKDTTRAAIAACIYLTACAAPVIAPIAFVSMTGTGLAIFAACIGCAILTFAFPDTLDKIEFGGME